MKTFSCIKQYYFAFILFFALFLSIAGHSAFAAQTIGQVVWVKGSVQAIDSSNQQRVLQRRAPIYEKDTIVTNSAGSGQIVFTDNSMVILKPGTTFRVDEYKYNPSLPSGSKYVASIAKGGFRTITGFISKANPDGYEVNTPVATIGVRGTDYSIYYTAARGLSVKLDRGAIVISNQVGTVEMNAKTRSYALIAGLRVAPLVSDKPISSDHSSMMSTSGAGAIAPPTKSGASKTVSGFCIE